MPNTFRYSTEQISQLLGNVSMIMPTLSEEILNYPNIKKTCSQIMRVNYILKNEAFNLKNMKTVEELKQLEKDNQFNYMLLSRCVSDLDYFFGNGQFYGNHLFYGEVNTHIREMINLWKGLPIKPQWLRATKLIQYKKRIEEFQLKSI